MTDLFDNDTQNSPAIVQVDPDKDYLTELVGEGKKFAEVTDLARGKAEADLFIEQLKEENASFREKLKEATTYDKLMNDLTSAKTNGENPNDNSSNQENPSDEPGADGVTFTQEQIDQLLEQKLSEHQSRARQAENVQKVQSEFIDRFGDKASIVLRSIGESNGLTSDELREMSALRPQVVISLAKQMEVPQTNETPDLFSDATPRATTDQFRTVPDTGFKTKAYFDKMKKSDPQRYLRPETELEMHRLALKNPDRFFSE